MDGAPLAASPVPRQPFGASCAVTSRKCKYRSKQGVSQPGGGTCSSLPRHRRTQARLSGPIVVPCPYLCLHPSVPAGPCPVLPVQQNCSRFPEAGTSQDAARGKLLPQAAQGRSQPLSLRLGLVSLAEPSKKHLPDLLQLVESCQE